MTDIAKVITVIETIDGTTKRYWAGDGTLLAWRAANSDSQGGSYDAALHGRVADAKAAARLALPLLEAILTGGALGETETQNAIKALTHVVSK